jgi:glutathione peroxidase
MSIYDLSFRDLDGSLKNLSIFKNKVLLLVNIATECGFASQLKDLQELHEKYLDKGLVVIAFPSNEFGGQQPGSDPEIVETCQSKYGVTFKILPKIGISLSKDYDPDSLYKYLQETTQFEVPWNFTKFIVGPDESIEFRLPDVPVSDLIEVIENNIKKINLEEDENKNV